MYGLLKVHTFGVLPHESLSDTNVCLKTAFKNIKDCFQGS